MLKIIGIPLVSSALKLYQGEEIDWVILKAEAQRQQSPGQGVSWSALMAVTGVSALQYVRVRVEACSDVKCQKRYSKMRSIIWA